MIQYALALDKTIPMVVDFGAVDSEWWLQRAARGGFPGGPFFRSEGLRLRAAEAAAAQRATRCLVASTDAADVVRRFAPDIAMRVIPDGVDVGALDVSLGRSTPPPTVVLNTSLASDGEIRDAVEFEHVVMPLVRGRVPGTRLLIVSGEPASSTLAAKLPGAELAGGIRDSGPLLQRCMVAVAPLRHGADVRRSVLEPMAAALPVVVTSRVVEQLAGTAGHELVVADAPGEFALRVVELLENDRRRADLGSRARRFVTEYHSWDHRAGQFAEMVEGGHVNGSVPAATSEAPARGRR
jgi:glycosyltransferase involved in cell wall biosynthesis